MTHTITPPPELVQQWISDYYGCPVSGELAGVETAIAASAAQWGADQELEECCHLLTKQGFDFVEDLRAARRPKPPRLKERALQAWAAVEAGTDDQTAMAVIRRALEQLPE